MVSMKQLYEPPVIRRVAIFVEESLLKTCKDDQTGCEPLLNSGVDVKSDNPAETKCFDNAAS